MKRILTAVASVAVASLTPLTPVADAAPSSPASQDTGLHIYYSAGKSAPRVEYVKPGSTATKTLARSMGYIDWGGCWPWSDSTDVIAHYNVGHPPMASKYTFGAQLKCGNDNYGYYHIEKRHKSQWAKITPDKGNSDWEGLASWALRQTLQSPLTYCDAGNNKNMYVGIMVLVQKGKPTKTIYVKSLVGRDTKNVITAYPARNQTCNSKNDQD